MEELIGFLKSEFPDGVNIMTPQFERIEKREFEWKPSTEYEFKTIIEKAPLDILIGLGFRKWDKMNTLIEENNQRPESKEVEIPILNSDDTYNVNLGKEDLQTENLQKDEWVLLFPGEWFDIIPEGFIVTGLYREEYPFKRKEADNDVRFGCLPYGIRKPIESGV